MTVDELITHLFPDFQYKSIEEATKTREYVDNLIWPFSGEPLSVRCDLFGICIDRKADYSTKEEAQNHVDPDALSQTPVRKVEIEEVAVEEPEVKGIDELFLKTKAAPSLYYLPAKPIEKENTE